MSDTANPVAAVETIGSEIVADAKAFIENTETELTTDVQDAWVWLQAELNKLEPTVLADLKQAIATAVTEAFTAGSSSATVVTDVLNILARDGEAILAQVSSDVVAATVGLTTAKPAA